MPKHVGRNDPCPCGSGKKFKKCCFQKIDQAKREDLAYTRFNEKRMCAKDKLFSVAEDQLNISDHAVLDFISDSPLFKDRDIDGVHEQDAYFPFFNILINCCKMFAYPVNQENIFLWDYCLQKFPTLFDDAESTFLASFKNSIAGFFQVLEMDSDAHMSRVQDVLTGKTYRVKDKRMSKITAKHDILGGFLLPYQGYFLTDGVAPIAFSPGEKQYIKDMLQWLYRQDKRRIGKAGNQALSSFLNTSPAAMFRISLDHFVATLEVGFSSQPILTKDKKEFKLIKTYYEKTGNADISSELLKIRGINIEKEGQGAAEIIKVYYKKLLLGEVTYAGEKMIFLSDAQDHLQKWKALTKKMPFRLLRTEEIGQEEILGSLFENIMDDLFSEKPADVSTEAFRQSALKEWDAFYQMWPDLKQPFLDNQSPAEAVNTKQGRQMVEDLIDSYENEMLRANAAHSGEEVENRMQYFNPDMLRKRLGLI